jgi:hypothetical protein
MNVGANTTKLGTPLLKKVVIISLAAGGLLTWLDYIYCDQPRNGPDLFIVLFIFPLRLLASAITKDRAAGEVVMCGLLVGVNTSIVFCIACLTYAIRKNTRHK